MLLATTVSPANGFSAFEELTKRLRKSYVNCTTCKATHRTAIPKKEFYVIITWKITKVSNFPRILGNYTHAQTVVTRRSFSPPTERLGTRLHGYRDRGYTCSLVVFLIFGTVIPTFLWKCFSYSTYS